MRRNVRQRGTYNCPTMAGTDPTPDEVRNFIAAGLACEWVEVEGDGRHFFATIVAAEFEGRSRVARHQRVYAALGDRMREQIHALSMKTLTPAEWRTSRPADAQPVHHP
jgi:acid stress-induced BolA-like protein IbaG/YrbA